MTPEFEKARDEANKKAEPLEIPQAFAWGANWAYEWCHKLPAGERLHKVQMENYELNDILVKQHDIIEFAKYALEAIGPADLPPKQRTWRRTALRMIAEMERE